MMLMLDFAVARFDCTGGNQKNTTKTPHGNRFNNNIDREYLSVNNNNKELVQNQESSCWGEA